MRSPAPQPVEIGDRRLWTAALLALPAPHVLQTWEWGAVKGQTGWWAHRLLWGEPGRPLAAASLLVRRLPRSPWGVAYVPKGPVVDWRDAEAVRCVLAGLEAAARRRRAIFVKVDPDVAPDSDEGQALLALLAARGWQPSAEQIQFRNTALLDLSQSDEALLAAMKPKWRYNLRLAQRRGVTVRQGTLEDLPRFYALYAETGARDGFLVRPYSYYAHTWRTFMQPADPTSPAAHLLLAEVEGEVVAGLMLFRFAARAWYMVGASSSQHRQAMPNHLLQWEAIQLARRHGCTVYDLWGAPDQLVESDPLWGVWRFKEGMGARFAPHIGAWDFPVYRPLYWAYSVLMPRVLDAMRRRHRAAQPSGSAVAVAPPTAE